eukprot:6174521-Pleurochrysis_carterae.AAC.4
MMAFDVRLTIDERRRAQLVAGPRTQAATSRACPCCSSSANAVAAQERARRRAVPQHGIRHVYWPLLRGHRRFVKPSDPGLSAGGAP